VDVGHQDAGVIGNDSGYESLLYLVNFVELDESVGNRVHDAVHSAWSGDPPTHVLVGIEPVAFQPVTVGCVRSDATVVARDQHAAKAVWLVDVMRQRVLESVHR
jgi:hypothetical protein